MGLDDCLFGLVSFVGFGGCFALLFGFDCGNLVVWV